MKQGIAALSAAAVLAGCVIVDEGDGHRGGDDADSYVVSGAALASAEQAVAEEPVLTPAEVVKARDADPYPLHPINLRRTTIIVTDMEANLALYRDALGMEVVYDQELTSPALDGRFEADGENRSRLALLQTNSSEMGMLGLWQFLDQTEMDLAEPDPADFTPGDLVLLFHTEDLEAKFAAAADVPGVVTVSAPRERRYPSPAGDIVVMVSMLTDMNGHTIELNEKIFDPRTQ